MVPKNYLRGPVLVKKKKNVFDDEITDTKVTGLEPDRQFKEKMKWSILLNEKVLLTIIRKWYGWNMLVQTMV